MKEEKRHCQILINCPKEEEANKILDLLLEKRLVAGGLITHGPSRYHWKGKIEEQEYFTISTFSLFKNKQEIISEVRKISSDETPIIVFLDIDGNDDFLKWIEDETR
jgi:periplasmic divalent cation tolerance protein